MHSKSLGRSRQVGAGGNHQSRKYPMEAWLYYLLCTYYVVPYHSTKSHQHMLGRDLPEIPTACTNFVRDKQHLLILQLSELVYLGSCAFCNIKRGGLCLLHSVDCNSVQCWISVEKAVCKLDALPQGGVFNMALNNDKYRACPGWFCVWIFTDITINRTAKVS